MEDAVYVLRGAPGDNAAALRSIAEGARSIQGRQALAELDAVPLLLSHLQVRVQNKDESMLLLLRALRNLCAGETQNQDAFVGSAGMEVAVSLARTCHQELVEGTDPWGELVETGKFWLDSVKALLQMLGNVAGRGEHAQAAVWEALFPDSMIDLACVSTEAVRGPLTMVLYTCCRSSGDRRLQLAQGKGASLLALLLRDSELSADSSNQWLTLLVEALCVKDEHFGLLFRHLGPTVGDQVLSSEQAVLLSMIYLVLDERNEGLSGTQKLEWNAMSDLVDIIEQAAVSIGSTSPIKENSLWPTGLPGSDVLGFSLLLGRLLCSHPGTHLEVSRRLVEICLEMLRALGPPDMIKKAMESNANEAGSSNGGKEVSIRFPTYNVYRGYRRDVLSVVANLSFRNYHVQELVRESGGLLLVLQQCVVDEGNPYLREWGLWAVRNLTEENEQNVKELSNLELKKSVNTEEILKAGFKVEVDNETRRPKLVNLAASDSQKS